MIDVSTAYSTWPFLFSFESCSVYFSPSIHLLLLSLRLIFFFSSSPTSLVLFSLLSCRVSICNSFTFDHFLLTTVSCFFLCPHLLSRQEHHLLPQKTWHLMSCCSSFSLLQLSVMSLPHVISWCHVCCFLVLHVLCDAVECVSGWASMKDMRQLHPTCLSSSNLVSPTDWSFIHEKISSKRVWWGLCFELFVMMFFVGKKTRDSDRETETSTTDKERHFPDTSPPKYSCKLKHKLHDAAVESNDEGTSHQEERERTKRLWLVITGTRHESLIPSTRTHVIT